VGSLPRAGIESALRLKSERLEVVFDACFAESLHTRLRGGSEEPLYQPADAPGQYHILYYREDFFASALHEVAHWCIAGPQRRLQPDFGYWYAPDGRSAAQQRAFERVECAPQALEWFFAKACGYRFCVSLDNLEGPAASADHERFRQMIVHRANDWQQRGLPERAAVFYRALCREFATALRPQQLQFTLEELR
jgi:elongation factor P hydroxylase